MGSGAQIAAAMCRPTLFCVAVLVLLAMAPRPKISLIDGALEPTVRDRRMVVYCMKNYPMLSLWTQGMMQDFLHVVGALRYGEKHGAAGVRVEFINPMYSNSSQDNYWSHFFEPVMDIQQGTLVKHAPEVHFNGYNSRFGMFGSFSQIAYGGGRDDYHPWPYPHPTCEECRMQALRELVAKYIHLKPQWKQWLADYEREHFGDKYVIGIHFRAGDKATMYKDGRGMGDIEDYAAILERIISNVPESREYVIFVASDSVQAVEFFQSRYKNVVALDDAPRIKESEALHKRTDITPWSKARSVIKDMLILSKSRYMIRNRSSVSGVAMLFSDLAEMPFASVVGRDEIVHFEGDRVMSRDKIYPAMGPRKVLKK